MDEGDRLPMANIKPFGLRMQPELKARVEEGARANNRSLNAEIIARLEEWFSLHERLATMASEHSRVAERNELLRGMVDQNDKLVRHTLDENEEIKQRNSELQARNDELNKLVARLEDRASQTAHEITELTAQLKAREIEEATIREIGKQNRIFFGVLQVYDQMLEEAAGGDDTKLKQTLETFAKSPEQLRAELTPWVTEYRKSKRPKPD